MAGGVVAGIMQVSTVVLVIVPPINLALSYLLVYKTPLSFAGAPAATSVSSWLAFVLLVGQSRLAPQRVH